MNSGEAEGLGLRRECERVVVRRGDLEIVMEASEEGDDWISVLVFVREVRAGLILVTPSDVEVVQAGALHGDVIEWGG